MRWTACLAFLLAAALPFGAAVADPAAPGAAWSESARPSPEKPAPEKPTPRAPTLDELYARLAAASDEAEANGVAGLIDRRRSRSGSDTADLLMSRSAVALDGKDAPLAVELLDRVTRMKPDWAEAWSRRAAAFFLLDDSADALADLHKALVCEPRLYSAWAAVGHIEMASGNNALALAAFRKALAIHPFFENMKELVDRLAPEIDGRDL